MVKSSRRVEVPAPAEETWQFVSHLPSVLPCVPGIRVGALLPEGGYSATIVASAGDFSVTFAGVASIEVGEGRNAVIRAKGRDAAGTISSEAEVRVIIEDSPTRPGASILDIQARFEFTGVLALAARAGGGPAAALLMKKFGSNVVSAIESPSKYGAGVTAAPDVSGDAGAERRGFFGWLGRIFRKLRGGYTRSA